MTLRSTPRLLPAAVIAVTLGLSPFARADSVASSASSAASQSVGSSSTSIEKSSDSSSGNDRKQLAAGDYEVVEMVALAERPGQLRLKLQPPGGAAGDRFYLYLPETTVQTAGLVHGQVLKVLARPYGWAFARQTDAQHPFYLVVQDTWLDELPSRPVTL